MGFARGWKLTLVIASTTPLVAIAGSFMMYTMASLTTKGQAAYAKAGAVATESLAGIRTIASFCAEPLGLKNYTDQLIPAMKLG